MIVMDTVVSFARVRRFSPLTPRLQRIEEASPACPPKLLVKEESGENSAPSKEMPMKDDQTTAQLYNDYQLKVRKIMEEFFKQIRELRKLSDGKKVEEIKKGMGNVNK